MSFAPTATAILNPWVRILGALEKKVNRQSFDTWLKPTRYSHSSGAVDDRASLMAGVANAKYKWTSLEYKNPTIRIVGSAAIVRFNFVGEQEFTADGKKVPQNLHILMNWQKQGADWKLLSRSATKL
jgi:hypothetical protein